MKRTSKITLELSRDEMKNYLLAYLGKIQNVNITSATFDTDRGIFIFEGTDGYDEKQLTRPDIEVEAIFNIQPIHHVSRRTGKRSVKGLKAFLLKEMAGEVLYPLDKLWEAAKANGFNKLEKGMLKGYLRNSVKATEVNVGVYQLKEQHVIAN